MDFVFNDGELETINNFKKLMHFDELVNVFKSGNIKNGSFKEMYEYLCNLNDLVEFKPSYTQRQNILKFNDDQRLMTTKNLKVLNEEIRKKYKDVDIGEGLLRFEITVGSYTKRAENENDPVFVDLDGCYGYKLKPDAQPEFIHDERYLQSKLIETIFARCFKYDDQNEWSRVACEYLLRKEIDASSSALNERLDKLTEYRRFGVDRDDANILILYEDMIEERKDKYGIEYWRVYLPKYKNADKAWINLKRDAIGNVKKAEGVVEVFLKKEASYKIHYIIDEKEYTKWSHSDNVILPILKPISDSYIKWLEDAKNPTFAKKLISLGIKSETKEDFTIALNNGEQYIHVHFDDDDIIATSYNRNFEYTGIEIEKRDGDSLLSIDIVLNLLSNTDAKSSTIGLCDYIAFNKEVESNRKRSELKLINDLDDMLSEDNDRDELKKVLKTKYP